MNILFVCTANIQRSLTAEHLCARLYPCHSFKSAGVSKKECSRNNSTLCTVALLDWADIVFTFEKMHAERIEQHTAGEYTGKIINLNIEDRFQYNAPELITLIKEKLANYLP
ncbi:hypothetical protein [uncultured Neptuniibacter sp.]|uniref:hypothetical protein n=1 Tax=uncultured Neptuniibacter sp. TaxID=502143 RepID=UPI002617701A|nr:hypothetical protein [uncultured Neptuniibacter sp.]